MEDLRFLIDAKTLKISIYKEYLQWDISADSSDILTSEL